MRIIERLHEEFPAVTYDVTAKIEHLLARRDMLPVLRDTGCLFVTTAVEAVQDEVLQKLDKGHTQADFVEAARLFSECGLTLAPTFIPFTPWTTVAGFCELLRTVDELGLTENVASVQWSLRLLITANSRLLELEDVRRLVGEFDSSGLVYPWRHPDPAVDVLAERGVGHRARRRHGPEKPRLRFFTNLGDRHGRPAREFRLLPRTIIPFMEEPWFC